MTFDHEILHEFVVESSEHLADIENQLLTIEAGGADIDVDLVNTVFRGVHSIKGAAGFLGLTTINKLAHSLENVLNLMRERLLVANSEIVEVMLRAADRLRGLVLDASQSNGVDVAAHVEALDQVAASTRPGTDRPGPPAVTPGPVSVLPEAAIQDHGNPIDLVDVLKHGPTSSIPLAAESIEPAPGPAQTGGALTPSRPAEAPPAAKAATESSIRVPVETLDQLMNLAGELVLGRNQLLQTIASREHGGLEAVAARINQVTSEMQDAIMQTRMQPIGNVFSRFTRVVRDLSNKLGKQCSLTIEGKEVEVDKTIVEAIADPLTHLVRNAVDHGMEKPDVRVARGKPPEGTLQLRALHESGKVRIEIRDDGAGIDAERIKRKALEKGLITPDQALQMSDREAVRLIFAPGFSTAEQVSDVSGRGVGMDVVRTNIEKLGGTVEIETTLGAGTTIHVTLPLTLAIIPSLIVQCDGDRFAIPQVNISELVHVRPDETSRRMGKVKDAEVLRLRGRLLPLVRLRAVLDLAPPPGSVSAAVSEGSTQREKSRDDAIIVVETGQLTYGLVVDGLFDSEEIVVKPLGRHLKACPCLSGATILGDGRVALILDVNGIAIHTKLRSTSDAAPDAVAAQEAQTGPAGDTHSLLLFTNHPDESFAIPMSVVARIERIRADQVDSVGGQLLLQYRGGSLPLLRIEDHLTARPGAERDRLFVIVVEIAGREIGIVAPNLEDIRDVVGQVDTTTLRQPGVMGSLVISGRAVRLIDVFELGQTSHPEWFVDRPTVADEPAGSTTILLAEDSDFFRKQVKRYLETSGYQIVECVDGLEALNLLRSGVQKIDLVVTDVQMPNMTGFELCRHIKDDPQLRHLPVIALTSLAADEDLRKGQDSGVDDYQIKMDRDKLLSAVIRLSRKAAGAEARQSTLAHSGSAS